jgi:hypothetical protein
MNDDVKLYGPKAKSNQFKTLRRRIAKQVDESILNELDDVEWSDSYLLSFFV